MQDFASQLQSLEPYAVVIAWVLFAAIFFVRKPAPSAPEKSRDRRSIFGILLQLVGYFMLRLGVRAPGQPFLPLGSIGEIVAELVGFGILALAVYLTFAAMRALGRHWSLAARLIQGHELITAGPYHLVRHPIYTAMFGMLIGTAIAISYWPALVLGAPVFLAGTALRIRAEEQLLAVEFGEDFRNYARRVPAFTPSCLPQIRQIK